MQKRIQPKVESPEKVKELMLNGFYLKRFEGENADYWGLQNDVINQPPHIIPVDAVFIPLDDLEINKRIVLENWMFPGKKPVVTTYKLKEIK